MEGPDSRAEDNFDFLNEASVKQHFANTNIELLRGRHIQRDEFYIFALLSDYEKNFRNYYKELYQLNLVKAKHDGEDYYYLDFPEESKGKLGSTERHRELTHNQIVIGIMLLNMYYEKYFEAKKIISWENIRHEILEGEYSRHYQRILFDTERPEFTDAEWDSVRRKFKGVLQQFDRLGWISQPIIEEWNLSFQLRPSINRFADIFKYEIENFAEFSRKINKTESE